MYASFINQFSHSMRYLFAFFLVFIIIPRLIFKQEEDDSLDKIISNYIKMVLLVIVSGYILVLLKLFELLSLIALFIILYFIKYIRTKKAATLDETMASMNVFLFDVFDNRISLIKVFLRWFEERKRHYLEILAKYFGSLDAFSNTLLIAFVFLYSAYLRFLDAITHAAPAMSDAYVTLEWIKLIGRRILFEDNAFHGVYPRGYHITLSTLNKFSAVDPLYVLKYSGPFSSLLICIGLYFFVSRITEKRIPGIISAAVYGIFGSYFIGADWERQAATNSQEFAFIFIMPTMVFFYKYIKSNKNRDLYVAIAGLCVMGLVHSFAFAFAGFCVGIFIFALLTTDLFHSWNKIGKIVMGSILSVILALLPFVYGMLMEIQLHGSSAQFLTAITLSPTLPLLIVSDYIALACLPLLLLFLLITWRKKENQLAGRFILFLGIATFALYYLGGSLTGSILLSSRSSSLWALVLPCLIGFSWHMIASIFPPFTHRRVVEAVFCFLVIATLLFYLKPIPIETYKMEYDSSVEQYLRISEMLQPTQWLLVSQEEGYSLVLGKSYHMMISEFMKTYSPYSKAITYLDNGKPGDSNFMDVFIYYEKKVFRTSIDESMDAIYDRREKEMIELESWIINYIDSHENLTIFFEDENLMIFRIHQEISVEEKNKILWGQ